LIGRGRGREKEEEDKEEIEEVCGKRERKRE
jgi:hypothetical protein